MLGIGSVSKRLKLLVLIVESVAGVADRVGLQTKYLSRAE